MKSWKFYFAREQTNTLKKKSQVKLFWCVNKSWNKSQHVSQEGYESSSCSGGEEEFGLSLYMFDTERTPAEDENILKELEPTILYRVPLYNPL